jgi:hypothetical protein
MAHCPFDKLSDILPMLETIRQLPAVKENKPGIFYISSQSFLHFHVKEDTRWADARDGTAWGAIIDLPFRPTASQKKMFLNEVFRRHGAVVSAKKSKRA